MLEAHIEQLAKDLNIHISKEEKTPGVYKFSIDEMDVELVEDQALNTWLLRSASIDAPHEDLENFFTKMLLANLFAQGTLGAVLGLDETGKTIILISHGSLPIEYQQ